LLGVNQGETLPEKAMDSNRLVDFYTEMNKALFWAQPKKLQVSIRQAPAL
jgi:hypothetical protein